MNLQGIYQIKGKKSNEKINKDICTKVIKRYRKNVIYNKRKHSKSCRLNPGQPIRSQQFGCRWTPQYIHEELII